MFFTAEESGPPCSQTQIATAKGTASIHQRQPSATKRTGCDLAQRRLRCPAPRDSASQPPQGRGDVCGRPSRRVSNRGLRQEGGGRGARGARGARGGGRGARGAGRAPGRSSRRRGRSNPKCPPCCSCAPTQTPAPSATAGALPHRVAAHTPTAAAHTEPAHTEPGRHPCCAARGLAAHALT